MGDLKAGDVVVVRAGATLFRVVGLDGDLAELIPIGGGDLPATVHVGHLRRVDAVIVECNTSDDFRRLSYYTLCKLSERTRYAYPANGLPPAIARGEFDGILVLDHLGNFIDFQ